MGISWRTVRASRLLRHHKPFSLALAVFGEKSLSPAVSALIFAAPNQDRCPMDEIVKSGQTVDLKESHSEISAILADKSTKNSLLSFSKNRAY